ncbi:uracil-DNA glycosylase [Campylobacterota bacterium]|nr:uracil-DNA glycosylase [Campylobacterota bacterium]
MEASWFAKVGDELTKPYMQELRSFLISQREAGRRIYPLGSQWFRAFDLTPFESVKVVILGQDPYHGEAQAHGLAFSVQNGIAVPPSLHNIYIELQSDVGFTPPQHGFLESWAKEGVLLLNATLTVEANHAGSHQNHGWERFTDECVSALSRERDALVFLLWGSYAQKKRTLIDGSRHLILTAPHPSPLSAYRGFFGCKHFSKANDYLAKHGITPVNWQL